MFVFRGSDHVLLEISEGRKEFLKFLFEDIIRHSEIGIFAVV